MHLQKSKPLQVSGANIRSFPRNPTDIFIVKIQWNAVDTKLGYEAIFTLAVPVTAEGWKMEIRLKDFIPAMACHSCWGGEIPIKLRTLDFFRSCTAHSGSVMKPHQKKESY